MANPSDAWWNPIVTPLSDLLALLDQRGEHLAAAHVAAALDCIARQRGPVADPS